MKKGNRITLRQIFLGLQKQMQGKLSLNRKVLNHPVAKGDATELEWIELLSTYLPTRYRVERAFVIDHTGGISEQIDVVIFDRHYSPFLFRQNGQTYVPAESVYAVIEVKQTLSPSTIEYAAKKAASVRRLERTSAHIVDRGVRREPRPLAHTFAGILTVDGSVSTKQIGKLSRLRPKRFLDFGCSVGGNSFYADWEKPKDVETSKKDNSLIFFFLKLLAALQSVGTVAPMEIEKYAGKL